MRHAEALTTIQESFARGGVIDTTLREGEQFGEFPGFTTEQAVKILEALQAIGVDRAELPNPLGRSMEPYIEALLRTKHRPKIQLHIRNHWDDFRKVLALKAEGVNLLTTVNPDRLAAMNRTLTDYIDQLVQIIRSAKDNGLETRVSVEHSWDHSLAELLPVYRAAVSAGVDRIGIADTRGIATHWEVEAVVDDLRSEFPDTALEIHFHNDFHSATTNALTALSRGARWVNTVLGGYGERTGITPLSVFLARMVTFDPSLQQRYHTQHLTRAEHLVAEIVGVPLPHNLITSENAFAHNAGIHIDGIRKNGPGQYEPFAPGVVGNRRHYKLSRISGKATPADIEGLYQRYGLR